MSIATQITRINNAKLACKAAIEGKGVTVPSSATLDEYYDYVDQIQTGSSAVLTVSGMKTSFSKGSAFSFGGTVTATIDGVSYDVTSAATFVPAIGTTLSTLGTQTVTVTVGSKSCTYSIEVTNSCTLTIHGDAGGSGSPWWSVTYKGTTYNTLPQEITVAIGETLSFTAAGGNSSAYIKLNGSTVKSGKSCSYSLTITGDTDVEIAVATYREVRITTN